MSVDTITAEYIGCNLAELILRHEERGRSQPRRPPPLATAPSWRRIFAGNVGGVRVLCGRSTNHLPVGPRTTVVAKSPSSVRDIISTLGIGNFNASEGINSRSTDPSRFEYYERFPLHPFPQRGAPCHAIIVAEVGPAVVGITPLPIWTSPSSVVRVRQMLDHYRPMAVSLAFGPHPDLKSRILRDRRYVPVIFEVKEN